MDKENFHSACERGRTETAQLIIQHSKDVGIDLNAKERIYGQTAWHLACGNGKAETAQLIIQSSNEFGIDLNAKSNSGETALHRACMHGFYSADTDGTIKTIQMILKNWKEFGIDIAARDNHGQTALDLIKRELPEIHEDCAKVMNEVRKMLELEYSQIDVDLLTTHFGRSSETGLLRQYMPH